MQKSLLFVLLTSVAFAGCTLGKPTTTPVDQSEKSSNQPVITESAVAVDPSSTQLKNITLEEIASHSTAKDCWFAVDGFVYDVTSYISAAKHPGGEAILEGCGKDASELFHTKLDAGKDHSPKAQDYLQTFKIGQLK